MEKHRYPKDWKRIALAVKESADWKCRSCGKQCRRPGEPFDTHTRTLTVHHINHTPEDCRRENLIALCAPCHLRADAQFHAEHRKEKAMQNDPIPGNSGLYISTEQFLSEVRAAISGMRPPNGENIIQVWYCKTVQNHKGLFITDAFDGHFYECTYHGDKGELYVDDYVKHAKHTIYVGREKGDA